MGHETLKLGDRTWREISEPQLSQLDHLSRFGLRLGRRAAVRPTDGLTPHRKLAAECSSAVVGGASARVTPRKAGFIHGVGFIHRVTFIDLTNSNDTRCWSGPE